MSAPCINDTCSITSLIDPDTRRLELNARIDPTGGLQCIDGRGLGMLIFGEPEAAAPIDTCYQQLGISGSGAVWSIPKRALVHDFSGDVVNIPQGGNEGDESADSISTGGSLTNPYDCQAMLWVWGRFEVGYTISTAASDDYTNPTVDTGDFIPFNAEVECRFKINGNPQATSIMDIGGIVPAALDGSHKRRWEYFAIRTSIGANDTISLTAMANHEGNNEVVNASTVNADVNFPSRGFRIVGEAIIMPFNNEAA